MGTGMWIWNLAKCDDGSTARIVARAQQTGLTHLVLKIADGVELYNGISLKPFVQAVHAAGVKCYVWSYTYGSNPEREAEVFGQRAVALGADAAVVDAEGDSYTNSPMRAMRFMRNLRAAVGDMHVGLSTHRYPSKHKNLPIQTFMEEGCDSGWPQAYYLGPNVEQRLMEIVAEWEVFGKPIVMTGAAYPEAIVEPADLGRVWRWCQARGIEQVNWWSYQHATDAMWQEIAAMRGV